MTNESTVTRPRAIATDVDAEDVHLEEVRFRIAAMLGTGRVEEQGCYGVRLTWAEWGRRIAARLGCPERADEIAAVLKGEEG